MKIDNFKIGDRVQVMNNGANASQFSEGVNRMLGVYEYKDWEKRVFVIEGSIKLTSFKDDSLSTSAHLVTTLDGRLAGYVYSYALAPAKSEWSYSISTNTIWFDRDFGRVVAKDRTEAIELATVRLAEDIQEMNKRMGGFAAISINLDGLTVEEIRPIV